MWNETISAATIEDVLRVLADRGEQARIIAGATDLILEIERGQRKGIETLVDISRIANMDQITYDEDGMIHLGPLVTHNHCVGSKLIRDHALPLARACWEIGSPQIRNRGTIAGNLVTASPANDTITPLMALGAVVVLRSLRGERRVPLYEFYSGVRRTVLQPDEMMVDIIFPALKANQNGAFVKFALRQAQAISLVNVAIVLTFEEKTIRSASITLGAVAPTIVHAVEAEEFLKGKILNESVILQAAELAAKAARPISDVRGSAGYRLRLVQVVTRRALRALMNGTERIGIPTDPILLRGASPRVSPVIHETIRHDDSSIIITRINGKEVQLVGGQGKSLLRFLREEAGLIGSKEGCAEGECGACTVYLDSSAVMSCMVPAARAHGAEIVTVEGLAQDGQLHPVQTAFVSEGAVQCGYCTPGFLMSAAKLLEERAHPNEKEIRQALTGNLCRCTGYYKIVRAIEMAADQKVTTKGE